MLIHLLLVVAGFVCLILGANWLVNGASSLAKKYGVSDLVIGLTIVSFGTSAPELVVNVVASVNHYPDIVFGNIIGSNNFNLFVILGVSGIILPITVQSSTAWKEIPISLVAAVVLLLMLNGFGFSGVTELSRTGGMIMLGLFLLFVLYVFRQLKNEINHQQTVIQKSIFKILGLIVMGLVGLIGGGRLVVTNSVEIAVLLGVSEKIIGLTIVAAGTSLPELLTSVVAAIKKNSDIAIGNVVGSNIFNILFVLSLSGIISPLAYDQKFNTDLYFLIGGTGFLLTSMWTGKRKKLDRWEAAVLLGAYLAYTVYQVVGEI